MDVFAVRDRSEAPSTNSAGTGLGGASEASTAAIDWDRSTPAPSPRAGRGRELEVAGTVDAGNGPTGSGRAHSGIHWKPFTRPLPAAVPTIVATLQRRHHLRRHGERQRLQDCQRRPAMDRLQQRAAGARSAPSRSIRSSSTRTPGNAGRVDRKSVERARVVADQRRPSEQSRRPSADRRPGQPESSTLYASDGVFKHQRRRYAASPTGSQSLYVYCLVLDPADLYTLRAATMLSAFSRASTREDLDGSDNGRDEHLRAALAL